MRFESIKISNYRQYRDVKFEFNKSTENDIHIIVASNGVGKTNVLNAINWCLYGDEPHTSGTSNNAKDKLPLCNLQALDDAKEREDDTCDVYVEIIATEAGKVFTIVRKATVNVNTHITVGKDDFKIRETILSGDTIIYGAEESKEIVDRYLPRKIREYFYFDGERLLNYFNPETNKVSHIKDSIYEIAQVNVINEVEKHLGDFEKKYNSQIAKIVPDIDKKLKYGLTQRGRCDIINLPESGYKMEIIFAKISQSIAEYLFMNWHIEYVDILSPPFGQKFYLSKITSEQMCHGGGWGNDGAGILYQIKSSELWAYLINAN